jgi:hypothetical protein
VTNAAFSSAVSGDGDEGADRVAGVEKKSTSTRA